MQHAESCSAVGPDQYQSILPRRYRRQCFLHVSGILHRVTIYLHNHVTALQAGIVGGAAGFDLLDHCAMDIA